MQKTGNNAFLINYASNIVVEYWSKDAEDGGLKNHGSFLTELTDSDSVSQKRTIDLSSMQPTWKLRVHFYDTSSSKSG
jgi:hypothetical protein